MCYGGSGSGSGGEFSVHFSSRRGAGLIRAEEAAGIALLAVILTALLILGCWYYRRRGGYKMIRIPNAPPAYEKIASRPSPPPYSP
ncbi:melanoma antigen recognized by T-cells 1 [Sinocyclocheilus rhinocerous]|uniref:melanoma antigen recognized by T-cells 1 n=1 Tax=Sinocyclocheilus rhinocerous TaxID=307959 RepID=UPI0007B9C1A1|nr:PREDICTED: melanoma antigen recognized by T-cells 1 [Sinocyclocheilus rhinocerous]